MTQGWRVETRLCPGTGTLCGYSPGRDSLGLGSWDGSYWRDTRDGFGLWTGFEVLDTLHRTSLARGETGEARGYATRLEASPRAEAGPAEARTSSSTGCQEDSRIDNANRLDPGD